MKNLRPTPHLLWGKEKEKYSTIPKKGAGFTMVDLLVSATVLIIIFSFVLASFRTGQRSGELDIVLKQVISGFTIVRSRSLGGALIGGSVPGGGYLFHVNFQSPDQFVLSTSSQPFTFTESSYDSNYQFNEIRKFNKVKFIEFCGSTEEVVSDLPCVGSSWQSIDWSDSSDPPDFFEVSFLLGGEILANYKNYQPADSFKYVGGVIEHERTNRQAYFYISLISGLITGDLYHD